MLRGTAQVSPNEVRQHFAEANEKVRVEYAFAPSDAADDEIEVTDEDLAAYYEENAADYEHPDQVKLEYAYFAKVASAADSLEAKEELERIRQEIEAGADFARVGCGGLRRRRLSRPRRRTSVFLVAARWLRPLRKRPFALAPRRAF